MPNGDWMIALQLRSNLHNAIHHAMIPPPGGGFGTMENQRYTIHPRKLTASLPLKNGGWKTNISYWEGNFWGTMLNFGGVCPFANRNTSPKWKTMTRKYQTMGLFTVYQISDGSLKKWMVKRKLHFLEDTAMEGYVAFGMRMTQRDNTGGFN